MFLRALNEGGILRQRWFKTLAVVLLLTAGWNPIPGFAAPGLYPEAVPRHLSTQGDGRCEVLSLQRDNSVEK